MVNLPGSRSAAVQGFGQPFRHTTVRTGTGPFRPPSIATNAWASRCPGVGSPCEGGAYRLQVVQTKIPPLIALSPRAEAGDGGGAVLLLGVRVRTAQPGVEHGHRVVDLLGALDRRPVAAARQHRELGPLEGAGERPPDVRRRGAVLVAGHEQRRAGDAGEIGALRLPQGLAVARVA